MVNINTLLCSGNHAIRSTRMGGGGRMGKVGVRRVEGEVGGRRGGGKGETKYEKGVL